MREKRKGKRGSPKAVLRLPDPDRGIGCIRLNLKSGRFGRRHSRIDGKPLRSLRWSNDAVSSRCHPKKVIPKGC
jgi:hypothetical protein